jgi:hypothetical protein
MKLKDIIRSVQNELPITMRMDKWLADNPNPKYSDEAVEFSRKVFTQEVGGSRSRRQPFRSSSMGFCSRRRIFSALGVDEASSIDAKLGNIFGTGNFLHLKWQMAGLTEGWLAEAEIPMDMPELRFGGTLDGKLFDGSGFEFKTIHSMGYSRVMTYGPKDLHIIQVHSYMTIDKSIEEFSIVYEDKNTGEWREYRVKKDPKIMKAVDTELGKLNEALDLKKLPKMLHDCETKEGATYRQCPFKDVCPKVKKWPVVLKGQVMGV